MSKRYPSEVVEVGKALLIFLCFVAGTTLLVTSIISAVFSVAFRRVLNWTSSLAVVLIILWQKAMWVPKNKGG